MGNLQRNLRMESISSNHRAAGINIKMKYILHSVRQINIQTLQMREIDLLGLAEITYLITCISTEGRTAIWCHHF